MKPYAFGYIGAENARHAREALAHHGDDARILAGGQSLMAVLNMRLAQPKWLVDISRTPDLNYVRVEGQQLIVGAGVTQAQLHARPSLGSEVPLLPRVFPLISHFQIRNRGTVCGSLAHADPSAELPLTLSLLGGELVLHGAKGKRILAANEYFQGMLTTARRSDEVLEEARFPLRVAGERYGFVEFSARHGDFAWVACATVITDKSIRLAVGGVADRPIVETWPRLKGSDLRDAINDFSWKLGAQDDAHVSAQYRRHLVRELGLKVIEEAI